MLGTFSFEFWFKSYCLFTERSLKLLEIAKSPLSPSSPPLLCFAAAHRRRRRRRRGEASRPPFSVALAPTRRPGAAPPPLPSRCASPGRATRAAASRSTRAGRHRDAAVASSPQSPRTPSFARLSTTRSPARCSSLLFASSLTPRPGTLPPLRRTPASSPSPSNRASAAPPPALTP